MNGNCVLRRHPLIILKSIDKRYFLGASIVPALSGVSFSINKGDFIAIIGASGSGKSTLLNIVGCLDRPDNGRYQLQGVDVTKIEDKTLAKLRNTKFGFIFQQFNLLPKLSALRNVELPLLYAGRNGYERQRKVKEVLATVGLEKKIHSLPSQLSGGEQQRVAIARALINDPNIILADEPTGNLDSRTADHICQILVQLHESGITIIMATHDMKMASRAERLIQLHDGQVIKKIETNNK